MRKVDKLGRIVIPMEMRKKYGLLEGSDIKFEDIECGILVKSAISFCRICNTNIPKKSEVPLCEKCISMVKNL